MTQLVRPTSWERVVLDVSKTTPNFGRSWNILPAAATLIVAAALGNHGSNNLVTTFYPL